MIITLNASSQCLHTSGSVNHRALRLITDLTGLSLRSVWLDVLVRSHLQSHGKLSRLSQVTLIQRVHKMWKGGNSKGFQYNTFHNVVYCRKGQNCNWMQWNRKRPHAEDVKRSKQKTFCRQGMRYERLFVFFISQTVSYSLALFGWLDLQLISKKQRIAVYFEPCQQPFFLVQPVRQSVSKPFLLCGRGRKTKNSNAIFLPYMPKQPKHHFICR